MTIIKYLFALIALGSNGESASDTTLELPITISPLVQDAIKRRDAVDKLVKKHANLFENVTFSDIVKGQQQQPLPYLQKNFAEVIQEAANHWSTVDKFEPEQTSKWTIFLSVEDLARVSRNIMVPLTDEVPLIVIQDAMFKVLEKRFNFELDEIEKHFGKKQDEIYAFLEPMWIKVVNFITEKIFKVLSEYYSISLCEIAVALNMKQTELFNVTLPQLENIKEKAVRLIQSKKCRGCPNGETNYTMHTKCECREDHYIGVDQDGPCYTVPLAVEDLMFQILNDKSVRITWKKPQDDSRFDGSLTYTVDFYHCSSQSYCNTTVRNALFFPTNVNLNLTYVIVSNLTFDKTYKLKVSSMNNNLRNVPSEKWKFLERNFTLTGYPIYLAEVGFTAAELDKCPEGKTTNVAQMKCECKEDHYIGANQNGPCYAVPMAVQDLKFRILSDTSVKITWRKPLDNGDSYGPLTYAVECYHCFNESDCDTTVRKAASFCTNVYLNATYVIVSNLKLNETYKLKVVSMNNLTDVPREKWKFSELNFTLAGCPIHHIRSTVQGSKCLRCPNGKTSNTMHNKCECKKDYYIGDNQDGPCYTVPLAVQDLMFRKLNGTSVNITWRKPQDEADFYGPLTYNVEFYHCTNVSKHVHLNENYVILPNLTFHKTYKLKVISMSNLKNVPSEKWKFSELNFTFTELSTTRGYLSTTPLMTSDLPTPVMQEPSTSSPNPSRNPSNMSIIVGITTVGLAILSVILIVLYLRRRQHRFLKENHRQNEIGLENVAHGGNIDRFTNSNSIYENVVHGDGQALSDTSSYQGNYENLPNARFRTASLLFGGASHSVDMLWEFPHDCLRFEKHLGEGRFGSVSKAKVIPSHNMPTLKHNIVAVKMLKDNVSLKDRKDFLNEVNLMKKLKPHPHVVQLLGCCTQSDPYALILEYLSGGDLLGFLRKSRGHGDVYYSGECYPTSSLTEIDLLSFAWMTADGMAYLAKNEIVHRDLAARNVLVGEGKVCKISDFGLARAGPYERKSKAWLPVKWMAPEDIFQGQCTSRSDVYVGH